jgi:hypothetical protein
MKILICYAWTKDRESGDSLVNAFKALGHEITTCGPAKKNFDGDLLGERDIKVYDKREHPERYTYDEILSKSGQSFDLILQCDSGFYFTGNKHKDVFSACYLVDIHRGGKIFRDMAIEGNFDVVFVGQKYFMHLLEKKELNCYWLPRAYDSLYIKEYEDVDAIADISFCGQSGIHKSINTFQFQDEQLKLKYHSGAYRDCLPFERFSGYENSSFEYAARAEILMRLSKDFNTRLYEEAYGENYAKAICRGKITVNRSLWFDSALRNFEVMACNRFLITDELPYQEELFNDFIHCRTYRNYYQPQFANFDLDYECIRNLVEYYLKHTDERNAINLRAKIHVEKNHTFINRAERIVRIVERLKKGCYEDGDRHTYS